MSGTETIPISGGDLENLQAAIALMCQYRAELEAGAAAARELTAALNALVPKLAAYHAAAVPPSAPPPSAPAVKTASRSRRR